jgi:hypothetical protein
MAKSEYLQREDAAKKQLGAKGVAKRVKQVPRAARLSVKELTGVNISRKGVTADPASVGLAAAGFLPFGKSISVAAKALKPVGSRLAKAATRVSRAAKVSKRGREINLAYEVEQGRGRGQYANKLRGFEDSWSLDPNRGFKNIARTDRRIDVEESAQEIASRLASLQRSKKNR